MNDFEPLRALLAPWGELRPQSATAWNGDIALPESVRVLYETLGPYGPVIHPAVGPVGLTIDTGGNPVCVPPLARLWSLQAGYRHDANTGKRFAHWRDEWLVIATEGANAFILDTASGEVAFNFCGGRPAPRAFAPDLATALGAVATVGNTLAALGDDAFDETFELRADARARIVDSVQAHAGARADAEAMLRAWAWYC